MSVTLYTLDLSPPCRAVQLVAAALGVDVDRKVVNLMEKEQLKPEFIKINPQHTVPTIDDNGFILWDSHAIATYLAGKYGKDDSLYPKDLQKRAIVDQRLHFSNALLFTRLRGIVFYILFRGETDISQEKIDGYLDAYGFMEAFLEGHDWLAGDQLTVADLCAVSSISTIAPIIPIDSRKYPKLTAWLNRCKALPYYNKENGQGAENLAAVVLSKITK